MPRTLPPATIFTVFAIFSLMAMPVALSSCETARSNTDPYEPDPDTEAMPDTDTVVINAVVHTMDTGNPVAEAFAYDRDGEIVAVGTSVDVRAAAADDATVIDAGGAAVLPGFQDAHVHVPEAGINVDLCYFPSGRSLGEYGELARECAEQQPGQGWVRAAGASLYDLDESDPSPLDVLDAMVPDRPVLVLDDLGHGAWSNSAGFDAVGIHSTTPDPQGGIIGRDRDGRLNGLVFESAQQRLRIGAADNPATIDAGLARALDELASNGITTISDAGGYWAQGHTDAWLRAGSRDELTVRAINTLYVYPDYDIDEQLGELERRFSNESDMLRFDTAKIYVDGILDLGTALLIDPYDQQIADAYPRGFTYFADTQLDRYVNELHDLGFRINFHVIGDEAARIALDTVEGIDAPADAVADRRHRTTHNYLIDPSDMGRFAQLGVIADMQQSPSVLDDTYQAVMVPFIGARSERLVPTADLLEAGATVILSSDWDADPLSPFGTLERSLTRETNAVPDRHQAIEMLTIDAAYALGHDDTTGSIEVGKFADYVVLSDDIYEVPIDEIGDLSVTLTVVGGSVVFGDPSRL